MREESWGAGGSERVEGRGGGGEAGGAGRVRACKKRLEGIAVQELGAHRAGDAEVLDARADARWAEPCKRSAC